MHESPRLVEAMRYSARRGFDTPRHSHREWELVYYTRGSLRATVGEEEFDTGVGTLLCTPPRVPHSETATEAFSNIYLNVVASADTPWPVVVHDDASGRIRRVLDAMLDEPDDERMRQLLMLELDHLIRRESMRDPTLSPRRELVARAEKLWAERLSESVRVERIAAELGVAPSTLRLAFVQELGMPPRERLAALRLERALGLLRTTSMTLDHIAQRCGFSSASHLSRVVRGATARSPGEVRRSGY